METMMDNLTREPAGTLRFGDLLPYFGQHVRSTQPHGSGMIRVNFIKRLGRSRTHVTFYPHELVFCVRAGSAR